MLSNASAERVGKHSKCAEGSGPEDLVMANKMRHAHFRASSDRKGRTQERGSWPGSLPYQAAAASSAQNNSKVGGLIGGWAWGCV